MRTSVVLAVIAAALLGYIFVFERGSISTGELEQRKGSALPQFVRARVSKLELQRKGVTTVLARDPEADVEDEAALWHVRAPYRAEADQNAVDILLGELEWLDGRRRLEGIDAQDEKRFGLTAPRYRLWFTVGTTRVPLVVGGESARGDGVYVSTGEPGVVYVVGKPFLEALDQDPGHFHSKELHEGLFLSTTTALTLRDPQGERALRKGEHGLWQFERGAQGLASVPVVQNVIDAATDLRARRFVARDVKDLARYGLAEPRLQLTADISQFSLTDKDEKGNAKREQLTLRIRAGAACEGHDGESYVTVNDTATVHCAADEDLSKLNKSIADLRESRLLPLAQDEITRVVLARGGDELVLEQNADQTAWTYALNRGGESVSKAGAREGAVADWLKALGAMNALRFDVPKSAVANPEVTLRFSRKDKPDFEVRAVPANGSELVALRDGEPQAVAFPAGALALLRAQTAPFRKLQLVQNQPSALRQLEVRRGDETERLVREGDGFEVQTPIQAPADAIAAAELSRLLSELEAVRFVADAPEPNHGLASPSLVASADYEPAKDAKKSDASRRRVVLRLGADIEGGRFAELEGERGVFVVSDQLANLLSAPLVSRTSLATPIEHLRAIETRRGPRSARVERQDEVFVPATSSEIEPAAAQALARAVATLRATRVVGYGPPAPDHGLDKPFAQITVVAEGEGGSEQRYTIALGAEIDGGRYARRDDQPVTFVLPKGAADALLPPSDQPSSPSN